MFNHLSISVLYAIDFELKVLSVEFISWMATIMAWFLIYLNVYFHTSSRFGHMISKSKSIIARMKLFQRCVVYKECKKSRHIEETLYFTKGG
jgi:hypothetical protein